MKYQLNVKSVDANVTDMDEIYQAKFHVINYSYQEPKITSTVSNVI